MSAMARLAMLSIVLKLSTIFGAFPMTRVKGVFVFSWVLYLYCFLLGLATTVTGVQYSLVRYFSRELLMNSLASATYVISWVVILVQFYVRRYSLPVIISELEIIDGILANVSYGAAFIRVVFAIIVLNAFSNLIYVMFCSFLWKDIITDVLYFCFVNMPIMVVGQYVVLMTIISKQLHQLTERLRSAESNIEVRRLVNIHRALMALSSRINRAFDVFLLQIITMSFAVTVLKVYIAIVYVVRPNLYVDREMMVNAVTQVIINVSLVTLIVSASMSAVNKVSSLYKTCMTYY